jgi:hypothetical protein
MAMSLIKFGDVEINCLNLRKSYDGIIEMIVNYLCDRNCNPRVFEKDRKLLSIMTDIARDEGLTYNQFNELLLLLNQDKVGEDFFNFFFRRKGDSDKVVLNDLKKGVIRFRGFALLRFGNFRFAYKRLIKRSEEELMEDLAPYSTPSSFLEKKCKDRPTRMLEIEDIPREKTWYVGELSGSRITREIEASEKELGKVKKGTSPFKTREFSEFRKKLHGMDLGKAEIENQAFGNVDVYLTWDYMDVYIATSMRNKWEFEETFDFTREVFGDRRLEELNLRYFDPTQSKCRNPKEKGLIEGLMLKRSICTIYLAQESDTMGKDSELAATLAQGKPVIAYVPKHNPEQYSQKIMDYPLSYFKKRLSILDAEEIFDDDEVRRKLRKCSGNFKEKIDSFLRELDEHRAVQPFHLWTEKDNEFKKNCKGFVEICKILAEAENHYFDNRAILLKERHPLSMQVNLHSGVSNGVLVVRSAKECADLLYRILTNRTKFSIKHAAFGYTTLEEEISKSPFRVVTDNERLTNSFWNLFF